MVFNTKTSVGTFNNAIGHRAARRARQRNLSMFGTLEPDVYFYGETIEKIGADKYRITKGGFTTCVQPTPRWEIVSGSATLNLDDYVDPAQRRRRGEGRAGLLPADALLPDPGGRPRHRHS